MKSLLLWLFAFTGACSLGAEEGKGRTATKTTTTQLEIQVEDGKGAHLKPQAQALNALVKSGQLDEASQKASDLQKAYEALFDKNLKQYTFQTQVEHADFKKLSKGKFEWIDWGYEECLQTQAFIVSERRDFPAALAILKNIESIAPVSAGTATEIGYILNQMGKPAEGMAAYRRAQALAKKYESQKPYLPMALRGIGYSLIDLGLFDEAEKSFLDSLEIEPGNKVALGELKYIQSRRAAK